jgi:hypothetical protein
VLCCSYFEDGGFNGRFPLSTLTSQWVAIEFDASLTGIGVLTYIRSEDGVETCVGGGAVGLHGGGFGTDSSFQNTTEFIGATIGLAWAAEMGYTDQTVGLRGDSMSALLWCEKERYRGSSVSNASVAYTLVYCATRLNGKRQHIEAAAN